MDRIRAKLNQDQHAGILRRHRRAFFAGAVAALGLGFSACEQTDIGNDCDEMVITNPGGGVFDDNIERSEGTQAVEYSIEFPCESLVCVRTLDRDPICSKECSDDSQCPVGFACDVVTTLGQFAGRQYCVWAECESDADCGDPWIRTCKDFRIVTETGPARFCAPRGFVCSDFRTQSECDEDSRCAPVFDSSGLEFLRCDDAGNTSTETDTGLLTE